MFDQMKAVSIVNVEFLASELFRQFCAYFQNIRGKPLYAAQIGRVMQTPEEE